MTTELYLLRLVAALYNYTVACFFGRPQVQGDRPTQPGTDDSSSCRKRRARASVRAPAPRSAANCTDLSQAAELVHHPPAVHVECLAGHSVA